MDDNDKPNIKVTITVDDMPLPKDLFPRFGFASIRDYLYEDCRWDLLGVAMMSAFIVMDPNNPVITLWLGYFIGYIVSGYRAWHLNIGFHRFTLAAMQMVLKIKTLYTQPKEEKEEEEAQENTARPATE